jgi:hypothetical protein
MPLSYKGMNTEGQLSDVSIILTYLRTELRPS